MGFGIVFKNQTTEEIATVQGRTERWPSFTTAESMAIAIALYLVNKEANIKIKTDSQTMLNNIRKNLQKKDLINCAAMINITYI